MMLIGVGARQKATFFPSLWAGTRCVLLALLGLGVSLTLEVKRGKGGEKGKRCLQ